MTETLHAAAGRWDLRFERRLAHPVEKVWRAITDPAELSAWFPADMDADLQEGGKILFVFRNGEGPNGDGTVIELDPPHVFAYTWGGDVLRWELRRDGDGCLLTFTHTFDERPFAASFAAGWTLCLLGLDGALAGRREAPDQGRWPELHESFVQRFGLDEGVVEPTPDGWVVRFERQTIRPVDVVWAALTGSDAVPPMDDSQPAVGGPAPRRVRNHIVSAGELTAVDPPRLLEYRWLDDGREAGRVRFALSEGRGGARLSLTQTIPTKLAGHRPRVLAAWHTQLELLADHLRGQTRPWPAGRTEELTSMYAQRLA